MQIYPILADQTLFIADSPTFAGLTISAAGKINFRDADILIGSTLTDGILDISADVAIDMFFDNADRGAEEDGQHLNINRRAAGDDYISLYVDKDRKGLIGFSGDDDLLQLAANALTVNGSLTVDTDTLVVDAVNHRVGVGIASPGRDFTVSSTNANTYFQVTNDALSGGAAATGFEFIVAASGFTTIATREEGFSFTSAKAATFNANNGPVTFNASAGTNIFKTGGTTTALLQLSTSLDQLTWGLYDASGNQFIFTNGSNVFRDHDHNLTTDPTFFVHSDLDPRTSNNQWGSFHHDQADFIIETGVATGAGGTGPTDIRNAIVLKGTGGTILGSDGGSTNYSKFEVDGTLEFNGAATVWKDINIGAATLSGPPGLQPGIVNFIDESAGDTSIATYGLAVGEGFSGQFELQHDYKEGTDIVFHLHWQGVAAPTGTDKVKFQLVYTIAVGGGEATLDAVTTITVEQDFDTQYEFKRISFAAITGTNINITDQFMFTLQRIAASADEYSGEALIATVGIHYEIDTIGSRQILTK